MVQSVPETKRAATFELPHRAKPKVLKFALARTLREVSSASFRWFKIIARAVTLTVTVSVADSLRYGYYLFKSC
jgi:hypothetical protein